VINEFAIALRPSPRLKGASGDPRVLQTKAARWVRGVRGLVSSSAVVIAVRQTLKEEEWSDAEVISVSTDLDPRFAMLFGGDGRWLVTCFREPDLHWPTGLNNIAQRREALRRNRGGGVIISAASVSIRDEWREELPTAQAEALPLPGARDARVVPDARVALGLDNDWPVALLFGSHEKERDYATVLEALRMAEPWHLLVGGQLTENLVIPDEPWARERIHVFPGRASYEMRDLLYSASDLVILSFTRGHDRHSGPLMDAVSYGIPVVCSSDCEPCRIMQEFEVGTQFEAADPHDLARVLMSGPPEISPQTWVFARQELSNEAVAAKLLAVLGGMRAHA